MICSYIFDTYDPCLFNTFMGTNAYQTISTNRLWAGRNLVRSLRSLTIPAKRSTLGACLSLISLRSVAKSRLSLDRFFGPRRHVKGETPIPVVARNTPLALSLRSIAKSRLSLDAGVSPSIDLYHIVTMHMKPINPYIP